MARQSLGGFWVDALGREVPRLDLVVWVVAQRMEDGAPALCAEVVVAKAVSEGAMERQRVLTLLGRSSGCLLELDKR